MAKSKDVLEEKKILKQTGQEYSFWKKILDKINAIKKGHTRTVELLTKKHKIDPKLASIISIKYQREKLLKK